MKTMKFTTILLASSLLAASAFGVTPSRSGIKKTGSAVITSPLRKDSASVSPLFRDGLKTRGGAVPGWAWYNKELDEHPLTAKACTSLVGWGLGDILAQVSSQCSATDVFRAVEKFQLESIIAASSSTRN